jgi:hypothetical protein
MSFEVFIKTVQHKKSKNMSILVASDPDPDPDPQHCVHQTKI